MLALVPAPALLTAVLAATPWLSAFHLVKVKQVYPGSDAAPNAQYVMLQMPAPGENFVGGKQVRIHDASGAVVATHTFPGNVPIGTDQSTILIATPEAQAFFAPGGPLAVDLAMGATIPALGGKACFFDPLGGTDVDCAAWGGYAGPAAGVGTAANAPVGLERGRALTRRMDLCGSPLILDTCDDTDDSALDFVLAVPAPRNNAGMNGVVPTSTCGNAAVQSLEQCDDGNVAPGDGCSATCTREAGAFVPQSLAVDPAPGASSDGNGVFESGEEVALQPRWSNAASVPLALTAAMSSFTGLPGAVYGIPDGSASYGTLAPGVSASCTAGGNCYSLTMGFSGPRPLTHWDAVAAEVNVNYGFKNWSVHIGDSFSDVARSNPFYRFVETLLHRGVTGGCTPASYCPDASTTREAMAVFVLVAKEPPGYAPPACGAVPMFSDVPVTSPFCRWVEELARRGVVSGCAPGVYCGSSSATRDAMAVFVLRTLDPALVPPACVAGSELFADVPAGSPFCRWIEELARRGVVSGCGGGNYCPAQPVSRQQMGVFLTVTFGLVLYGP